MLGCPDPELPAYRALLREYDWLLGPEPADALLNPYRYSLDNPWTATADSDAMPFDTPEDQGNSGRRHRPFGDSE